jgi:pyridoxal biosynthesis lyase PdxS
MLDEESIRKVKLIYMGGSLLLLISILGLLVFDIFFNNDDSFNCENKDEVLVNKIEDVAVEDTVNEVKSISKKIKVLCGAGITTGDDMKAAMDLGADGVLLASGIIKAESPKDALLDLVSKL